MKRLWTIIGVRDVPRSFRWYQTLLGLAPGVPAHPDFGQLIDADGTVLLCLHEWGVEDHPTITTPDAATPRNRSTVCSLCAKGELPCIRVGSPWCIDVDGFLPRERLLARPIAARQ